MDFAADGLGGLLYGILNGVGKMKCFRLVNLQCSGNVKLVRWF